jgi:hypothetical protein
LNRKKKVIGYVEGKKYYNKKRKLLGYLEGDCVKNKNGRTLLRIDRHNDIYFGKELVGFVLDSKIYFREEPIFEYSKEKREIQSRDGKTILDLKGNHYIIEELDLFGIAVIFLENMWWIKVTK